MYSFQNFRKTNNKSVRTLMTQAKASQEKDKAGV